MVGDDGADIFFAVDGEPDVVDGSAGDDVANVDCDLDQVESAEERCG